MSRARWPGGPPQNILHSCNIFLTTRFKNVITPVWIEFWETKIESNIELNQFLPKFKLWIETFGYRSWLSLMQHFWQPGLRTWSPLAATGGGPGWTCTTAALAKMDLTSSLFSQLGFHFEMVNLFLHKSRSDQMWSKVLHTNCYTWLPVLSVGRARIHTEDRGSSSERITWSWGNRASVDRLRIYANLTLVIFNSLYLFYWLYYLYLIYQIYSLKIGSTKEERKKCCKIFTLSSLKCVDNDHTQNPASKWQRVD